MQVLYLKIMLKQHIILFIGILCCLCSCSREYVYRVEGKLTNLEDQTLYVVFEGDDYRVVDTVICEKPGQFRVDQQYEGFNAATVFFENKKQWITVYLEPGVKISISGDARTPMLLQVKGGRINEKLSAFRKENAPLLKEYINLSDQLNGSVRNSAEETDMASRMSNIQIQLVEQAANYIKENPDEEASVVMIQSYFMNPDDTRKMDELLALLDPELKNFYLMRELEQYSVRAKRTVLGAEAPGFSVKNINGKTVGLNSFPDKYLLLAFTAPWCDMCQTEDLYLDKVTMKYPKEELDILLISLDNNQAAVREALKKDSIEWNLVTDSAGQASMLLDLYNVSALPRCFLIDEEGKIILKTESGKEIKQTLEKLFDE